MSSYFHRPIHLFHDVTADSGESIYLQSAIDIFIRSDSLVNLLIFFLVAWSELYYNH